MWDPWSLDLELPFVAKLKHKSKRSVWETAEHLKGQVWGISHCVLLNLLPSYSSYLYQLLGRLKWAVFSLFYVFFLCYFHFVHTMPCISDKLHVLISPGLTQSRWQVLVYYGSIILQVLYYHAGSAVRLEFHWLVQNCNVLSRPCRFCRGDSVSCLLDGYGRSQLSCWLVGAGGSMKWGCWESRDIWPQRPPPFQLKSCFKYGM